MRLKYWVIRGVLCTAIGAASFVALAWAVGFADNTDETLGAAAIGAFAGLITIRLWPQDRETIRRMRGRCPQCNYDLQGELDKGCSECGWGRA